MKTFKLSILLLIFIVLGVILYMYILNDISDQMLADIGELEEAVRSEDWGDAEKQLDDIHKTWEKTEKRMAMMVNHNEIDVIKLTLAKLSQYVHYRETADFMAESASLKLLIKHIPNKEKINLANLL
ncbi:MAG: DUF4363 family protein [Clostridia bacterium]